MTQIANRDISVRIRDVLRSQILVIHHPVDLELCVQSTLLEILSVDVRQVLFPSQTQSQVVDQNVQETQIVIQVIYAPTKGVL